MSFNTFCNICFAKENIIKLNREENEPILNNLIFFTSCPDVLNGIIYLCINCCNKLEEYDNFREMCLTNFVRFRYLYNEHKKQLEIRNAPDIEIKLKAFVDVNVERPIGTPLIENFEAAHVLRNDTKCIVEFDDELTKIDLDEVLNKNDISDVNIYTIKYNNLEKDKQPCHEKYENDFSNEDQEKSDSSVVKNESNRVCLEESYLQLVSDTVANSSPWKESADDISEVPSNPEDCVQDISTDVIYRSPDNENKTARSDTVRTVCDESFSCNSNLAVHMRTHIGDKHCKCDKCHKTYTGTANLKIHDRFHSGKRPYKCDECDYRCTKRFSLKTHKLTHTGEKPYKCDECGLGFGNSSNLKAHKRIHTGEKPYKCDECGLGFTTSSNLIRHKLTHTGQKPYKCDECDYRCTDRFHLKTHKLKHTGEKPHKCDECDYRCTERSTLKVHKRTHTGEKLYKCDECGLQFTRRFLANVHKLKHTDEKPYKCHELIEDVHHDLL